MPNLSYVNFKRLTVQTTLLFHLVGTLLVRSFYVAQLIGRERDTDWFCELQNLNKTFLKVYCMWLNFILMGVGPYVILITLNTLMLLKLKEIAKEREMEHLGQGGRNNSRYCRTQQSFFVLTGSCCTSWRYIWDTPVMPVYLRYTGVIGFCETKCVAF